MGAQKLIRFFFFSPLLLFRESSGKAKTCLLSFSSSPLPCTIGGAKPVCVEEWREGE